MQAPVISGTVAGQSTPSGQTDTPFSSVTITDPNTLTTDSLSIQITGGGGTLADGAGFSGLTESPAGVYLLAGTAAAITSELDALVFTPSAFSATTTLTLTDTTSRGTSKSNAKTTVTVTNGQPVYSVSYFLAHQGTLDKSFNILDSAANITASLHQLHDSHLNTIVISDNGNVGVSIAQLSAQATAIGKLQNANLSPVLLAITDTTADIKAGLSTLVAKCGRDRLDHRVLAGRSSFPRPRSWTISRRSTRSSAASPSRTSQRTSANLDQLDDPNISAITISDNGQISASVAQLTADATAIGDLSNANGSPVLLAINDTAGDVQTGLSTLVQDTGEIGSITNSYGPIVVSVATFLTDQPALDKIAGGFDVSDSAANLVAYLSALNADSNVAGITADIGEATLSGGVGVNALSFSESGWGTSLTVGENLAYAGAFTLGSGSMLSISSGGTLTVTGTGSSLTIGAGGELTGFGVVDATTLANSGEIVASGGTLTVQNAIAGTGGLEIDANATLVLDASTASGAPATFAGAGATLTLESPATFAGTVGGVGLDDTFDLVGVTANGASVNGSNQLVVTDNGTTVDTLQLSGNNSGFTFLPVSVSGGTDIVALPIPATVADALDVPSLYDQIPGGFAISDTAANVSANLTAINTLIGEGRVTSLTATNVTGQAYSAYEYNYVGGVFAGSQFTFTTVPTGATYSSYDVDYDQAGNFTGEQFFFTNITGQFYTGEQEDFDASGAVSSVLLTGITDQAYSSLELDYSAGTYEGYQAFYTGITGQSYTSEEVDISAAGQLEKVVYSGMTSTPYSSVEADYSDGALADFIYNFTNVTGASYYSYQVEDNPSGAMLQETLDLNSGGHDLIATASGQTLTSLGDDTMTGSTTGSTTFVLNAVYGADTIANLTSSDIVSMPTSEFANFTVLSRAASFGTGAAVITATDGDTLTLDGIATSAQLKNLSGDFTFHA